MEHKFLYYIHEIATAIFPQPPGPIQISQALILLFILTLLASILHYLLHAGPNFLIHNKNMCGFYFHEACYKARKPPCPLFE